VYRTALYHCKQYPIVRGTETHNPGRKGHMAHTKDENCNDNTYWWYKYSSQAIIQSRGEEDPATKVDLQNWGGLGIPPGREPSHKKVDATNG
jgi:hypothetical protein